MIRACRWGLLLLIVGGLLFAVWPRSGQAATSDPRYFPETGFRISDDKFWDYFQRRGGLRTFGYPVSRKFLFMGTWVQFFQRRVMQLQPDGSVGLLNVLDPGLMPFTTINGATFPAFDEALVRSAPAPGTPGYHEAVLRFVEQNTPDLWQGQQPGFLTTFRGTVTLRDVFPTGRGEPGLLPGFNLEMWGIPTSRPQVDPNNHNFIYQRFQRGIMHYDRTTGLTQGILLADYLKAIITGQNLPPDLESQARTSPLYRQYDNSRPDGVARPEQLPATTMKDAFEREGATPPTGGQPAINPPPQPTSGLRYGFQAHLYYQDQRRIYQKVKEAGFGWVKQQIRWADVEQTRGQIAFGPLDQMVDLAQQEGINLLFSVVTAPAWSRGGRGIDGPPDDYNEFGRFLGELARRYRGRVKAYEIWNEQNFSREWGGGRINPAEYIALLKVAYRAIKEADPDAIVVSGALTPTGVMDPTIAVDDAWYLDQMYQVEGGVFLRIADAVGAHATGYNNAPDDWVDRNTVGTPGFKGHPSFYFRRIDDLHAIMERYGDRRQMWITEYHWASAQPPVPPGYEWTTHLSEQQAADFLVRGFQMMRERPWVGAAFVWNLNFRTFQDYHTQETAIFGVLNPDWSPRLLYTALKNMPK